jgi:haloacetate dehalogenase
MWRDIAPLLAQHFTVVCADLHGYGRSTSPTSRPGHFPYTKRAMAKDMASSWTNGTCLLGRKMHGV